MTNCSLDRNLSEVIHDVWVFSLCIHSPLDTSQTMMHPSLAPDMTVLLSLLMVTLITHVLCSTKTWKV